MLEDDDPDALQTAAGIMACLTALFGIVTLVAMFGAIWTSGSVSGRLGWTAFASIALVVVFAGLAVAFGSWAASLRGEVEKQKRS